VLLACAVLAGLLGLFALPGGSFVAHAFRDLMGDLTMPGVGRHGLVGPLTGLVLVLVVAGGAVAAHPPHMSAGGEREPPAWARGPTRNGACARC
jgi:hypothetical protein